MYVVLCCTDFGFGWINAFLYHFDHISGLQGHVAARSVSPGSSGMRKTCVSWAADSVRSGFGSWIADHFGIKTSKFAGITSTVVGGCCCCSWWWLLMMMIDGFPILFNQFILQRFGCSKGKAELSREATSMVKHLSTQIFLNTYAHGDIDFFGITCYYQSIWYSPDWTRFFHVFPIFFLHFPSPSSEKKGARLRPPRRPSWRGNLLRHIHGKGKAPDFMKNLLGALDAPGWSNPWLRVVYHIHFSGRFHAIYNWCILWWLTITSIVHVLIFIRVMICSCCCIGYVVNYYCRFFF